MVSVELSSENPFLATLNTHGERHNLGIKNFNEIGGAPKQAGDIFRTLIVAHLVAPEFPEVIETNFPLQYTDLIDKLYRHYGHKSPKIIKSPFQVTVPNPKPQETSSSVNFVSGHSGGLDSVYRIVKLITSGESVLAVHLKNLNAKAGPMEAKASRLQAETWNVPYVALDLVNGSKSRGHQTMRTRDLLLAMATLVVGYNYGAKEVVIEGDFVKNRKNADFSEYSGTWKMFNTLLKKEGLATQIVGMDAGDIETVGEVIKLEKELGMPVINLVQNCFSASYQLPGIRRKWERETPQISKASSEHWCGSCIKCRRMTLGRIYYKDPAFTKVPDSEIEYFVEDTYRWLRVSPQHADMISESFKRHLASLLTSGLSS